MARDKQIKGFIITEKQCLAIMNIADDISAMIGCGDDDTTWIDALKKIDKMLSQNGFKRSFK